MFLKKDFKGIIICRHFSGFLIFFSFFSDLKKIKNNKNVPIADRHASVGPANSTRTKPRCLLVRDFLPRFWCFCGLPPLNDQTKEWNNVAFTFSLLFFNYLSIIYPPVFIYVTATIKIFFLILFFYLFIDIKLHVT